MNHGFSPPPPPLCRLISAPGVTENVRNSEDCIWVTIMLSSRLTNGKPIKACSLQRWPSLQTSNVFDILQIIFNNGSQQALRSDFLFTSLRIKPTSYRKWTNNLCDPLNSLTPTLQLILSWIVQQGAIVIYILTLSIFLQPPTLFSIHIMRPSIC